MNELYPVAKLGDEVLVINKDDIPLIGKENAEDVKCVSVDLKHKRIDPLAALENHLKFNPWEETSEEERSAILQSLATIFPNQDILEKIIKPLVGSLVDSKK